MKAYRFYFEFVERWLVYLSAGKSTRSYLMYILKSDLSRAPQGFIIDIRRLVEDVHLVERHKHSSFLLQSLFELMYRGLIGESIAQELEVLRTDLLEESLHDLDIQIRRLPVILSLLMVLFIFPAYLILLLGPVIQSL